MKEQLARYDYIEAVKSDKIELCMNVAPARIAVCEPPSPDGLMRTPWCHMIKGHDGPHVCGEYRW